MEKIMKTLMLAVMMVASCTLASAQKADKQEMTREQLAEVQARHIARQLAFDDETTAKFVDAYSRCQKEIWALGPRKGRRGKGEMTDAQAGQAISDRFEHSQKLLDIRQKYYAEYSKFLTQKQIQRVYDIEKRMMKRLAGKGKKRAPKRW